MFMDSNKLAELAAIACDDKKAKDIQLIYVEKVTSLTDWIIIVEALSDVQVRGIVSSVENTLKEKANRIPLRLEGLHEAKWALIDYGELIINVFQTEERYFYDLESFWSNGKSYKYSEITTKNFL